MACDPIGEIVLRAQKRLETAARDAWLIAPDEHIAYERGSRSYDKAPRVFVVGGQSERPFTWLPEFTPQTRAREVAMAMEAAAVVLSRLGRL